MYSDWEALQAELKNNDIHEGYQNPTISVLHFWVRELDGSISHYISAEKDCKDFLYKHNGNISAEECDGFGADNVMFWTSWSSASRSAGKKQNIFSDQQIHVLKYSPISR